MTEIPVLEGYGCRLRPVVLEDAGFIVFLRNQPFANGTIHSTSPSIVAQQEWIRTWQKREADYYWIIEDVGLGKPIGTIGFYDIDADNREGMPGRWVMMPQANINVMVPVYLMYRYVFEVLKMKRLIIDVVATNKKVLRFHKLYGASFIDIPPKYLGTDEEVGMPMVWFEFREDQWPAMVKYWEPILEVY